MQTPATEDYLKAIYSLEREQGEVTNGALAEYLGVAPASVTGMSKKLVDMELVTRKRYRDTTLTPAGRRVALEVVRHHRLIERFLVDVLGIPWDRVHEEAHRLEHALSEEVERRIDLLLGHPETCPHGSPIPTVNGRVIEFPQTPLAELVRGQAAVVAEVKDEDAALLRYLGELHLYPGTEVEVLQADPFQGPLTVSVAGQTQIIGLPVAHQVWVREAGAPRVSRGEGGHIESPEKPHEESP